MTKAIVPEIVREGFDVGNFPVKTGKVWYLTEDGKSVEVQDKMAVIRDDTKEVVSIVGKGYTLVPHRDVLDNVEAGMSQLKQQPESARVIYTANGSAMQTIYEFPKIQEPVSKGDLVRARLRVVNSYDTSRGIGFYLDAMRLVCTNGLISAKRENTVVIRHVGDLNPEAFSQIVAGCFDRFQTMVDMWGEWNRQKVTKAQGEAILTLLGLKGYVWLEKLVRERGDFVGTRWNFYNALTRAISHDYDGARSNNVEFTRLELGQSATKFCNNDWYFDATTKELKSKAEEISTRKEESRNLRHMRKKAAKEAEKEAQMENAGTSEA